MLPRRRLPPELAGAHDVFCSQAERIEQARQALLSCLPDSRGRARAPVEVGIDLLADELDAVLPHMEAWRVPELDAAWQTCAEATRAARQRVGRARSIVGDSDQLHDLVGQVAALVQPLETWADAEERWHALRRWRRGP